MFLVKNPIAGIDEIVNDFRYNDFKSILVPASKILIGDLGTLQNAALYYSPTDLVMDLTLGAANLGLDTGAEAQDQWYAVYAVPGANGSYGLRFSVNPPHAAGGIGPVGFSKYRYLGLIRNGGNHYDATNSSYGRGDIVRFNKLRNKLSFHGFHTTNGGLYPVAPYSEGINLYIANTATNGFALNVNNANYIGLSGFSPNGTPKLPYRAGLHGFNMVVNPGNSTSAAVIYDSGEVNERHTFGATYTADSLNFFVCGFEFQFTVDGHATAIRTEVNNNANCSRGLWLTSYVDPYILGGK